MKASSSRSPILDVVSVDFSAPNGGAILKDVTLHVEVGQIVAIVGPNGAGKSTLIRLMAGLAEPHRGEVRVAGRPLREMRFDERARTIAYVGQSEEPDGRLTIAQYVALGLSPRGVRLSRETERAEIEGVLGLVGLEALAHRRLDRVSGGERQKAKIARAMCQRPKLLILDEPTNHLDPYARGELLGLAASMNVSVVAAMHDLTLIDDFADKVAMIENGRLKSFDAPIETLSVERVRDVFRVGFHRFVLPNGGRKVAALDIVVAADHRSRPASRNNPKG